MHHPKTCSCGQYSTLSNNHANAITLCTWFVNLCIVKPPKDTSLPSKIEILYLLDSSASICVLALPTSTILADHFLNCSKATPNNNDIKTLTIANKPEVPILFIEILRLHTSIHGRNRTFVVPFAVAIGM